MPDRITQTYQARELLSAARRRAGDLVPFSPAWDAAMARIEDLERQLWDLRPMVLPVHHELTAAS